MTDTLNKEQACQIHFSTQSGRAKACARRCARLVRERTSVRVLNRSGSTLDDGVRDLFDWCETLRASDVLLILFVSTTGDGEHTDSIQRTWKLLLQKSVPKDLFQGINFAIFSLGDRAYGQNFCAAGRKLAVRLLQLGAKLVGEAGYGDDGTPNGGVFADLDLWLEDVLLSELKKDSACDRNELGDASPKLESPYRVTVYDRESLTDSSSCQQEDAVEEWQVERFRESYQQFFEKSGSNAAYRYDEASLVRTSKIDRTASSSRPLVARVSTNHRITAEDWEQDTRHIRLEVTNASGHPSFSSSAMLEVDSLPYRAGDVASVLPSNSSEEVERFLRVLPKSIQDIADRELLLEYDDSVEATAGVGYPFWPPRCTLRGWLSFCADIHALPEREDLRALSYFCAVDHLHGLDQQSKLKSLSETSESALYADYILREKRSWAEVLYDFDSIRSDGSLLNIDFLVSLLSPIRPRDFSISSSPTEQRTSFQSKQSTGPWHISVDLCVAVVRGTTPLGRSYHGLCSHYLARQLVVNETERTQPLVRLWIRPGSFQGLPLATHVTDGAKRLAEPVLFIGAGTGIAPLRGLIREREAVRLLSSIDMGPLSASEELDRDNILVFGCRKESVDFYYKDEWEELLGRRSLGLLTAFSRDQWHKIYVQQVLEKAEKEHKLITRHLLENNGSVYIAGGPQMARTVKEVIVEAIVTHINCDEKQALLFISKLQRMGKFAVEAWG